MESKPECAQELLLKQQSSEILPEERMGTCGVESREGDTVVASLNGALLREADAFPYYMLVAFEAGGIFRAVLLLLCAPLASFLSKFVSRAAGIQVLIFVSLAGLKVERVQSVARAVLPKFFREDINPAAWKVFSAFGTRYLITSTPRIMVQTFAREFLGVDEVIGTELEVTKGGRVTGFLKKPGVLEGSSKASVLRAKLGSENADFGMGNGTTDGHAFVGLCKVRFLR